MKKLVIPKKYNKIFIKVNTNPNYYDIINMYVYVILTICGRRCGMFGYVKPVRGELLVKEEEFYRATYCGICRSMKKHTGALSNVTLSYDSVFLALVRMLYIPDSDFGVEMRRCIAHPMKKRGMTQRPASSNTQTHHANPSAKLENNPAY